MIGKMAKRKRSRMDFDVRVDSRQKPLNKYAYHLGLEAIMMFFIFYLFSVTIFFNFHALLYIDDAPLRCGKIYGVIKAIKIPIQLHLNLNYAIDNGNDDNNNNSQNSAAEH